MAVSLTENAKSRVRALVAEHDDGKPWLRLRVTSGGCSGMMYDMDWVAAPGDGDKTFEFDDVKVCVDRKSYLFLNGIELDFEDTLVRSGFVFHNPAAKRSCSCGESFTL
ncbi:MAG: iron-sulfur cluster assembly accessory protein [Myxococcota bacterium]